MKSHLHKTVQPNKASIITPFLRPTRDSSAGIIAIILAFAIGAMSYGYSEWYQNPEKVVHDAISNLLSADSISATGSISYIGKGFLLDVEFEGGSQGTSGEARVKVKVNLDSSDSEKKQEYAFDSTGRFIDNILYFKIIGIENAVRETSEISYGSVPSRALAVLGKLEDRWISLSIEDSKLVDQFIPGQKQCLSRLWTQVRDKNDAANKTTKELYSRNRFLTIEENLGEKAINGTESFGYVVAVDHEKAGRFYESFKVSEIGKTIEECGNIIGRTRSDSHTSSVHSPMKLEVWVDKYRHTFTQVSSKNTSSDSGTFSFAILPSFKPLHIGNRPANSTAFKKVLQEIQREINESYYQQNQPGMNSAPMDPGARKNILPAPAI